jgi:hypothetical protein
MSLADAAGLHLLSYRVGFSDGQLRACVIITPLGGTYGSSG